MNHFAVVFQACTSKKVHMEIFTAHTEAEAANFFRKAYANKKVRLLSVTHIPN